MPQTVLRSNKVKKKEENFKLGNHRPKELQRFSGEAGVVHIGLLEVQK